MQRHCPMAAAGLQSAADRVRSGRHPLETYRQILMIGSLADEAAAEMAIITDVTVNHRCALERIEPEPLLANCHKSLRRCTAGGLNRHNGANPAALEPIPRQNLSGLQALTHIPITSTHEQGQKQTSAAERKPAATEA
jgi:hypothetical protein